MNTVLGSNAPPLTVNLLRVFRSGSKDTLLTESQVHFFLHFLPC